MISIIISQGEVLGLNLVVTWGLSVWVLSRYSGLVPQSELQNGR